MKCKHRGAELIATMVYIEAGAFHLAAFNPAPYAAQQASWQPMSDVTFVFPNAAAAAPCAPTVFTRSCFHEPAIESVNAAGAE